jgi:uncharacterized protein
MRRKEREIRGIAEMESIISQSDVCRIALADSNIPYIITMNFGYTGEPGRRLFFHCAPEGRKIEMIRRNNYVCFEFDTDHKIHEGKGPCDYGMSYRSVVGYGRISIITGEDEKIKGLDCIMSHYTGRSGFSYDRENLGRMLVLRLDIAEMTGKKAG